MWISKYSSLTNSQKLNSGDKKKKTKGNVIHVIAKEFRTSSHQKQLNSMQPSPELGAIFGVYVPTEEQKQKTKEE